MSDDLKAKFKEVDGIGDAKAAQLIDIVNAHEFSGGPLLDKAIDAAKRGDDRTAAVYLRRANAED